MSYIENIEEIESKLDPEMVLNYLQPNIKITHRGDEIRTCCPVHKGEGIENFCINQSTKQWICHSKKCKGTNLIDLVKQSEKIKFVEAAEKLALHFNVQIQYRNADKPKNYTPDDVKRCWNEAASQRTDTYFSKKNLQPPPCTKFGKNPYGYSSTLIPYKNIEDKLLYVLSINGNKKFQYKVEEDIKGSFALIGKIDSNIQFYIGEGIATVQTAWEATERKVPAVSCGTWSNIIPVLEAIKNKYPNSKPIVLIDRDEGNNGLKTACEIKKKWPDAVFRMPFFNEDILLHSKKPTDFNDIISKCGQSLEEVRKQLSIDFNPLTSTNNSKENIAVNNSKTKEISKANEDFYDKLGKVIGDPNFTNQLKNRNYEIFESEHKKLFTAGGLVTGYEKVDAELYFAKGDFVTIQAMSNHGKSTLMLQMAQRFLTIEENLDKDPMCVFITYESMPIRIEEKFLNLLGNEYQEGTPLLYDRKLKEKHLYPDKKGFIKTISTYNNLQMQNKINILKSIPLERLENVIDVYQAEFPHRTLVLFLDYIQIIETISELDGWEKIKKIAYTLEQLAIKKEIILFTASQVNENRQVREGRDIYNASTTVLDLFNHSHASLKLNKDLKHLFIEPVKKANICTFSATKQKHGSSFQLSQYFLFNGYSFTGNSNETYTNENKEKPVGNNTVKNFY